MWWILPKLTKFKSMCSIPITLGDNSSDTQVKLVTKNSTVKILIHVHTYVRMHKHTTYMSPMCTHDRRDSQSDWIHVWFKYYMWTYVILFDCYMYLTWQRFKLTHSYIHECAHVHVCTLNGETFGCERSPCTKKMQVVKYTFVSRSRGIKCE